MPGDTRRSRHGRAHEMGAAAGALPTFEIPVGCRCAALAGFEPVVVDAEKKAVMKAIGL